MYYKYDLHSVGYNRRWRSVGRRRRSLLIAWCVFRQVQIHRHGIIASSIGDRTGLVECFCRDDIVRRGCQGQGRIRDDGRIVCNDDGKLQDDRLDRQCRHFVKVHGQSASMRYLQEGIKLMCVDGSDFGVLAQRHGCSNKVCF